MTETAIDTKPTVYPTLRYENAPAAIEWLGRAFGFKAALVVPNPDGTIAHAELSFGPGVIMLGSSRDDGIGKSPRQLNGVTGGVYVYVAEIDAHYERARAEGADIIREITDQEYGSREYTARDLEGHVWSFGTYRP